MNKLNILKPTNTLPVPTKTTKRYLEDEETVASISDSKTAPEELHWDETLM